MQKRRWWAIGAVALVLVAQTAAGAQTTTSSTSTPPASTTTTVHVDPPCLLRTCTQRPPEAFLSGSGGEVNLNDDHYCWREPGPNGSLQEELCHAVSHPVVPTLVVRQGERLSLRFAPQETPSAVVVTYFSPPGTEHTLPVTAANPSTFLADVPVGQLPFLVKTTFFQGAVDYLVTLDVRAPAPPPSAPERPVRFTG